MQPDARYQGQPESFWAYVRAVGEAKGYSIRGQSMVKAPTVQDLDETIADLGIPPGRVRGSTGLTDFGETLLSYFQHRANVLNSVVRPSLMDVDEARRMFEAKREELQPRCPLPMNKQRGAKKAPPYFTGLINMLIESALEGDDCDYDPKQLTKLTDESGLLRTLARRVDGACPSAINPVAIWEIKEYYYTTTFGSRVAGGIYETLLDGMELKNLAESHEARVLHYLFVDSHRTWWLSGRSYLCRLIDALHMGYVDEVLFGREVLERLPMLVDEWRRMLRFRPT